MLCDLCHKEEAIMHWTVLVNNQKTDLNLCENCAVKKGLITPGKMKFKELLPLIPNTKEMENTKCSNCGLSIKEFQSAAKLGCPQCYEEFKKILIPLLKYIHGNAEHIGKIIEMEKNEQSKKLKNTPEKQKLTYDKKRNIIEKQLKTAIANESYEEAACLRDELKKLEDENK